jgi:hypothetical protein
MITPVYLVTIIYVKEGDIHKEVVNLSYVPSPGHRLKHDGFNYVVINTVVDTKNTGITLHLEEL